jgi:hypothetical protein
VLEQLGKSPQQKPARPPFPVRAPSATAGR